MLSVIRLAEASYRKMQQNLAWAAGYSIVATPLAARGSLWPAFRSARPSVLYS